MRKKRTSEVKTNAKNTVKEVSKDLKDKMNAPVVEKAKETVKEAAQKTEATVKAATKTAKATTKAVKETTKEATKAVKETTKATTKAVKETARTRVGAVNLEIFETNVTVDAVKKAVKNDAAEKGLAGSIVIYLNAEERAAYYTVDGVGSEDYRVDLTTL